MHSRMLDDDDHILSTKLLEYNKQSSSLDEAPSSTLSAEADPLVTLTNYDFEQNGNWGEGENLGESLENLKINGNDGFQNSEISDSSFGGTENVSMDTYSASQWVPGAMNPMLSSGFTNDRLLRAHTVLTPSQSSSAAVTFSPLRQSGYLSEGSSEYPWPYAHTTSKSSAVQYSHDSDSAWETVPTTPSVDDYDLRPVPDNNSASMQSYNDPQTGIWPHEDYHRRGATYKPIINMRYDHTTSPAIYHTLPQVLQEVIANADAATPFDLESSSYGDTLMVGRALGVDRRLDTAAPSLPTPSISGGSEPQFSQSLANGPPKALMVIASSTNSTVFPVRQSPADEPSSLPSSINQNPALKAAPGILMGEQTFPATYPQSPTITDPRASDLPPSLSTHSSTTSVVRCTYRGCRAKFKGGWTKDSLRRHWLVKHNPKKQRLMCPECHLIFQSLRRDNLKRHMREKHPNSPFLASLNVRGKKSVLDEGGH